MTFGVEHWGQGRGACLTLSSWSVTFLKIDVAVLAGGVRYSDVVKAQTTGL